MRNASKNKIRCGIGKVIPQNPILIPLFLTLLTTPLLSAEAATSIKGA